MSAMTEITSRKEKGFTLIELVMVIVILGILAAFALPRFANFTDEARVSTIKGAAGSVRSAASIAHARWVADGSPEATTPSGGGASTPATVTLSNQSVNMSDDGYPTADANGIGVAAQLSEEFSFDGSTIALEDADGNAITGCSFTYSDSDGSVTLASPLSC